MSKTISPYKDTSQIVIELEENLRIYISNNARALLPSLDKNELSIIIELNPIARPTLIKYQYITDNTTRSVDTTSNTNTKIHILINNRWNKYQYLIQELNISNLLEKPLESYSTTLKQAIDNFLDSVLDYSNRKLPVLGAFYKLLVALSDDAKNRTKVPLNDQEKLQLIEKIVVNSFTSRPPNIESLALTIGMSVSKMKLLFKDYYGESIYQFHQKAKLNYAAELLKTQRYTVSQVAYKVGYTQSIKFIKIFEKHFGITPGKFKTTDD